MNNIKDFLKSLNLKDGFCSSYIKMGPPIIGYKLSSDTKKYPYWTINTSSYDKEVAEQWSKGNVILVHPITAESILMSISQAQKYISHPDTKFLDFDQFREVEDKILAEMEAESEKAESTGSLVGYLMYRPVADGHATYKVVKATDKSVWLELRKFGDGYQDSLFGLEYKLSKKDFLRISHFGKPSLFGL